MPGFPQLVPVTAPHLAADLLHSEWKAGRAVVTEFPTPAARAGVPEATGGPQALSLQPQCSGYMPWVTKRRLFQAGASGLKPRKSSFVPECVPRPSPGDLRKPQGTSRPACTPFFSPCTRSLIHRSGQVSWAPCHTLAMTLACLDPCQPPASLAPEKKTRA